VCVWNWVHTAVSNTEAYPPPLHAILSSRIIVKYYRPIMNLLYIFGQLKCNLFYEVTIKKQLFRFIINCNYTFTDTDTRIF
jgi:hypothetical protein